MEASLAEAVAQRQELEAQARVLREVNDDLSARISSWKESQPHKEAEVEHEVERSWMERQTTWEATFAALHQRIESLELELGAAQQRGDAMHRQWSELHLTHQDTLEHLKQAYRDVIDANGKVSEEHRVRLAGEAKIQEFVEREALWHAERSSMESKQHQANFDLRQSQTEQSRLSNELAATRAQLHGVQDKWDDRVQEPERHARTWREKHDCVVAKLEAAHASIASLEANATATSDRLAQATAQLTRTSQSALDAADLHHQLKKSLQDVEGALARRTKEKNDAVASVARLNELHQEAIAAFDEKERMLETVLGQKQAELDALTASIESKNDEIGRLKRQNSTTVASLEDQFKRLQVPTVVEANALGGAPNVEFLRCAFDQLSMEYHDTRIAYEARQSHVEQLEAQLRAADTATAALRQSLSEQQDQLEAVTQDRRDMEARFRELQSICHDLVAKNEHAEDEIHALRREKSEVCTYIPMRFCAVDTVRRAFDDLKAAHATLQDKLRQVQQDTSVRALDMEATLSNRTDALVKAQHEVDRLTVALEQRRAELDEVAHERSHLQQTTQALNGKCSALETQVDSLRTRHVELERALQENKQVSHEWRNVVEKATSDVHSLERELRQAQDEVAAASNRIDKLDRENKSLHDHNRDLAETHADMSRQIQAITASRDDDRQKWQVSIAQWTAARERSHAMVEALQASMAEKESALAVARRDLDAAKTQLQLALEQRNMAENRRQALVATNESLQAQVASQTESFQTKHVEEFASLREACHDVAEVNRMLTTERDAIHARLRQWLANWSISNGVKAAPQTDDVQEALDKVEGLWRDHTNATRTLADTVMTLNAKLMATVDGSVRFEEEVGGLVRELLDALNQPPTNQPSPRDDGGMQDALAQAIAIVRAYKQRQPVASAAGYPDLQHEAAPRQEENAPATNAVVSATQRHQHDLHVAQLNDHLSHLMQQCLALQARNDKYKKQLHVMRQREKLLERDLLLAIK
ncbi:hypothetical protein DYB32_000810 [Aphanomyces invadans]|uniref:Uncharacterized protein n=1 Tax=Aphanomyces invadans TaxID=157072 RepID=A0A418B8R4_9STRA|nr:hypothetical protein DYB32_000810 [Aphanomyces invadans]